MPMTTRRTHWSISCPILYVWSFPWSSKLCIWEGVGKAFLGNLKCFVHEKSPFDLESRFIFLSYVSCVHTHTCLAFTFGSQMALFLNCDNRVAVWFMCRMCLTLKRGQQLQSFHDANPSISPPIYSFNIPMIYNRLWEGILPSSSFFCASPSSYYVCAMSLIFVLDIVHGIWQGHATEN